MLRVAHTRHGPEWMGAEEKALRLCLHTFGHAHADDKIFRTKDFPLPGNGTIRAALSGRAASFRRRARCAFNHHESFLVTSRQREGCKSALEEESSL